MAVSQQDQKDVETILSHRYDLGGDFWTTPDKRLLKGAPFSTLESALLLLESGMEPSAPLLKETAALIFSTWREDGRFKLSPQGGIYPCQTAEAAKALCHMGYADDPRLQKTFQHLLHTQCPDGGWRCNKFSFGRGPETEYSNPLPTLLALDAFRFSETFREEPALHRAVDFLLEHWSIRAPIGPCHYGMGTLFMQVEYPFRGYNLFQYVYILSFYSRALKDDRFGEAFAALKAKVFHGQMVVERVVPKLRTLSFCQKGEPSIQATLRYHEILKNINPSV